jgi:hypothetical protein
MFHPQSCRWWIAARLIGGLIISVGALVASPLAQSDRATTPQASNKPNLAGDWTYNNELSDHPDRVDLGVQNSGSRSGGSGGGSGTGGGGTGRHGGFGGFGRGGGFGGSGRGTEAGGGQANQLSTEDRLKIEELVDEIKKPSPSLTIAQTQDTVAVTDSEGHTRTFRTNGKKDKQQLEAVTVSTKTKWEGDKLVAEYDLPGNRRLTYTYSLTSDPRQLLIEETVAGGSQGSSANPTTIKRIYDPK